MKFKILELGSFVPTDQEGFLINNNSIEKIQIPFDKPISSIIATYCNIFESEIHSIYVRGSVARGKAIVGFSDFDCFALLNEEATEIQIAKLKTSTKELLREFDFVTNFDLYFLTISDLNSNKDLQHWKFTIKLQSICIFGEDIGCSISGFKPGIEIIYSLFHLEKRISKAKERLFKYFDPESAKYWCSWIMRTFVRSGFELVLEKEKKYTNELYLCYRVFSNHYPLMESEMKKALELAINPITNIGTINRMISLLGDWLVAERDRVYFSYPSI